MWDSSQQIHPLFPMIWDVTQGDSTQRFRNFRWGFISKSLLNLLRFSQRLLEGLTTFLLSAGCKPSYQTQTASNQHCIEVSSHRHLCLQMRKPRPPEVKDITFHMSSSGWQWHRVYHGLGLALMGASRPGQVSFGSYSLYMRLKAEPLPPAHPGSLILLPSALALPPGHCPPPRDSALLHP